MIVESRFYPDGEFIVELETEDGETIYIVVAGEIKFDGHIYCAYYSQGETTDNLDILEGIELDDGRLQLVPILDVARYELVAEVFVNEFNELTKTAEGGVN